MFGISATRNNFPSLLQICNNIQFKLRPEDFQVIEVDEDGIVIPTTNDCLDYKYPAIISAQHETDKNQAASPQDDLPGNFSFSQHLTEPQLDEIKKLIQEIDDSFSATTATASTTKNHNIIVISPVPEPLTSLNKQNQRILKYQQIMSALEKEFGLTTPKLRFDFNSSTNSLNIYAHPMISVLVDVAFDRKAALDCWIFLSSTSSTSTNFGLVFGNHTCKESRCAFHEICGKYFPKLQRRARRTNDGIDLLKPQRRQRDEGDESGNRNDNAIAPSSTFTHFILEKRNMNAFSAEKVVAQNVILFEGNPASSNAALFSRFVLTCGNKDKRAVTYQRVSVPTTDKVRKFFSRKENTKTKRDRDGKFIIFESDNLLETDDNYSYVKVYNANCDMKSPLSMGQLGGNVFQVKFKITRKGEDENVANVKGEISSRIEEMKRNGVANFFGPQRFGVSGQALSTGGESKTPPLGFLCACGKYQEAVFSLFESAEATSANIVSKSTSSSSSSSSSFSSTMTYKSLEDFRALLEKSKQIFRENPTSQGADMALKLLPPSASDIADILRELRRDFDFRKAICSAPFSLRQIRVHSAQSLIFNELLSRRMSTKEKLEEEQTTLPLVGRQFIVSDDVNDKKLKIEIENEIIPGLLSRSNDDDDNIVGTANDESISLDFFVAECEAMLGSGNNLSGATRQMLMRPKQLSVEFENESTDTTITGVLRCQLPAGSFVSVVLRELFGIFPVEF